MNFLLPPSLLPIQKLVNQDARNCKQFLESGGHETRNYHVSSSALTTIQNLIGIFWRKPAKNVSVDTTYTDRKIFSRMNETCIRPLRHVNLFSEKFQTQGAEYWKCQKKTLLSRNYFFLQEKLCRFANVLCQMRTIMK